MPRDIGKDLVYSSGLADVATFMVQWRCAVLTALPRSAMHSLLSTMFMALVRVMGDRDDQGKVDPEDLIRSIQRIS